MSEEKTKNKRYLHCFGRVGWTSWRILAFNVMVRWEIVVDDWEWRVTSIGFSSYTQTHKTNINWMVDVVAVVVDFNH